jgi:hypothetical protein
MRFEQIECSEAVADKLWNKRRVEVDEVREVLTGPTRVRRTRDGL